MVLVATRELRSERKFFVWGVAKKIGLEPFDLATGLSQHGDEFYRLLAIQPPVYFEDDPGSLGMCSVCNKRGFFTPLLRVWHVMPFRVLGYHF